MDSRVDLNIMIDTYIKALKSMLYEANVFQVNQTEKRFMNQIVNIYPFMIYQIIYWFITCQLISIFLHGCVHMVKMTVALNEKHHRGLVAVFDDGRLKIRQAI